MHRADISKHWQGAISNSLILYDGQASAFGPESRPYESYWKSDLICNEVCVGCHVIVNYAWHYVCCRSIHILNRL
jgi:hypothetical protein